MRSHDPVIQWKPIKAKLLLVIFVFLSCRDWKMWRRWPEKRRRHEEIPRHHQQQKHQALWARSHSRPAVSKGKRRHPACFLVDPESRHVTPLLLFYKHRCRQTKWIRLSDIHTQKYKYWGRRWIWCWLNPLHLISKCQLCLPPRKKNRERKGGKKATTKFCSWECSRVSGQTDDHKSPCEGYSHTVSMVTKLWGVAGRGCCVRRRSGRRWSTKRLYRLCNHRNLLPSLNNTTAQMATKHSFFWTLHVGGGGSVIRRLTSEAQPSSVLMSPVVLASSTNVSVIRSNTGPCPAALPRQRLCSEVKATVSFAMMKVCQ